MSSMISPRLARHVRVSPSWSFPPLIAASMMTGVSLIVMGRPPSKPWSLGIPRSLRHPTLDRCPTSCSHQKEPLKSALTPLMCTCPVRSFEATATACSHVARIDAPRQSRTRCRWRVRWPLLRSRKARIASTGPKISSRAMVMSFRHVAEYRRFHVVTGLEALRVCRSRRRPTRRPHRYPF